MSILHTPNGAGSPSILSTNPVLERVQSQWYFSPSELLRSPSVLEGLPVEQELANRQKGVNFITQVGIMLKLPQLTLATASVYLHRFFMRHAMALPNKPGLHHYSVAATALFLATKVEENCRKMKELIVACCRVAQKQPNLVVDEQSKEYWKWRDTILHNEDLLLEALCFDLQLDQPYRILFDFLCYYNVQTKKHLRNTSWAFLNDSHVTTLCLQLTPRVIAGAALYAGAKWTQVTLPDDEQGRPWWEHLELNVQDIQKACNVMADVYENPQLPRQGQKDAYAKEEDIFAFDRTRHATSPMADRSPERSVRSESQGIKRDRDEMDGDSRMNGSTQESAGRSPKRQRQENGESEVQALQRLPSAARDEVVLNETSDDVQQKIDAIVNASSQNPRPSSRIPPPRRVSTSIPSRPLQSTSEAHPDRSSQYQSQSVPQAGMQQNGSLTQVSQDPSNETKPLQEGFGLTVGQPVEPPAMNDDTEQVDYGSEEGEV